jgi:hypothetical protein
MENGGTNNCQTIKRKSSKKDWSAKRSKLGKEPRE